MAELRITVGGQARAITWPDDEKAAAVIRLVARRAGVNGSNAAMADAALHEMANHLILVAREQRRSDLALEAAGEAGGIGF